MKAPSRQCAFFAAILLVAVGSSRASGSSGLATLRILPQDQERIEKLERRVAELEKKLKVLEEMALFLNPAIQKAVLKAKIASCANNLSQLWKLEFVYASQFGGRMKSMPKETGPAFWLALTKTRPPLVDETEMDVFLCPAGGQKAKPGFTSYRGPKSLVSALKDDDPVGCCEPGCHPDGTINVLQKNGDVTQVGPKDELYQKALAMCVGDDSAQDKEKRAVCRHLIDQLGQACKSYELDYAIYPTSGNANMVKAITTKGPKKFPYFEFATGMLNDKGEVLDPWGHPLVYFNNGDKSAPKDWTPYHRGSFDLYSFGPNGKDDKGKGDDVNNWD